jgi:hypothetical protein
MNQKTSKLLRRMCRVTGKDYRQSKRLWNQQPRSARGRARMVVTTALEEIA